jgi:phytoene dehydrogenase-like protein
MTDEVDAGVDAIAVGAGINSMVAAARLAKPDGWSR